MNPSIGQILVYPVLFFKKQNKILLETHYDFSTFTGNKTTLRKQQNQQFPNLFLFKFSCLKPFRSYFNEHKRCHFRENLLKFLSWKGQSIWLGIEFGSLYICKLTTFESERWFCHDRTWETSKSINVLLPTLWNKSKK